jgi:hypothetical protein
VHSEQTWLLRRLRREAQELCSDRRVVDFGVLLYTVQQDDSGVEIRPDGPRVVRTREPERFGGVLDTRTYEWIDESPNPVVWMVSEEQRRLILHGDDLPLQVVCEGAEGAGKTTGVLARWNILRAIERIGQQLEFGCVAPTQARLERVRQALAEAMPPEWYVYRQRDWLFRFALGHQLRLVSAHRQSDAEGSPVQGYDWAGGSGDEAQDQLHIIEDVRARGRRAPRGRYPMMLTATVKGTPQYRSFRDKWRLTKNCGIERLSGFSNPYVEPDYWEARKRELTEREYKRRVLAQDVGPERMLYPSWSREHNLRPIPQIGAEPIARETLAQWGPNLALLGGHDPGKLFDVTLLLKPYRLAGMVERCWWVVDEVTTEQTTAEQHVQNVLERLRTRWNCNMLDRRGEPSPESPQAFFRADPYSDSGNDEQRPDRSVYTTWRRSGLRILPASLVASTSEVKPARVPKEAGIEMICTLLCNAKYERRLFVACDERRQPVAPRLVESLEMSERDSDGKAETQKKNVNDLSHWPAALRYALWELEKPRAYRQAV